jgi:hypothetical protein
MKTYAIWFWLAISCVYLGGCDAPVDPRVEQYRNQFLVRTAPAEPISLTEAKNAVGKNPQIAIIGRVGTGTLDPFEKGKLQFVLSEAPAGDHSGDENHDDLECIFCRRRIAEAPLAQVEFLDKQGSLIPIGANELFKLRKGQTVVVQGQGRYDEDLDTLFVTGESLYVRP